MTSDISNNPIDPAPGQYNHNVTVAQAKQPNIISHKVTEKGTLGQIT